MVLTTFYPAPLWQHVDGAPAPGDHSHLHPAGKYSGASEIDGAAVAFALEACDLSDNEMPSAIAARERA